MVETKNSKREVYICSGAGGDGGVPVEAGVAEIPAEIPNLVKIALGNL